MFQKKKIMLQEQDSLWPHLMNISDGGKKNQSSPTADRNVPLGLKPLGDH